MSRTSPWLLGVSALLATACGGVAQSPDSPVRSTDPELRRMGEALLVDLAERSGLEIRAPVVLETRSREQLVRYLEAKLDEELPADEARATTDAYALLGLMPDTLDLRALLLDLYTEQVAGFYDPDSTALFVLDDQPAEALQGLLVHELVHAVQDQNADLDALTDRDLDNDRQTAAQAAIEGHATLVMLDYMAEQITGTRLDMAALPDFAGPALQQALAGMAQYPSLSGAPPLIQQGLLFPYLEGAGYVQELWRSSGRVAPFGELLPVSTEQVLARGRDDEPVLLELSVEGAALIEDDDLGRMESGLLLRTHLGEDTDGLADGWGGDRWALVEVDGRRGLAWISVWDDRASRDRFVEALAGDLSGFPRVTTLDAVDVDGRPGALLRVGLPEAVRVRARVIG